MLRLMSAALALAGLMVAAAVQASGDGIVKKRSAFSVKETVDRLERTVSDKGFTVFARVDHAAGAAKVGQSLRPAEVLIFGNPAVGTRLLSSNGGIALDLPVRVAAWEAEDGTVWVAYDDPAWLAQRHGITDRDATVRKMTGALGAFTNAAAKLNLGLGGPAAATGAAR